MRLPILILTALVSSAASADTIHLTLDEPTIPPDLACHETWTESGLTLQVVPTALDDCGLSLCLINPGTEAIGLIPARLEVDLSPVPGAVELVEMIVSTPALGIEPICLYDGETLVGCEIVNHTFPPDTVRVSSGGAPVDRLSWEPCFESSVFEILIHFEPAATNAPQLSAATARGIRLESPRPHPMRRAGQLRFTLDRESRTVVTILDVAGRRVRTLADRKLRAGSHAIGLDLRDDSGSPLPAGVYFQRVVATGLGADAARFVVLR